MNSKLVWIVVLVALVGGTVWLTTLPDKPGELDSFASCVAESETTFFGAFWCPHCQEQKAIFGRSARLLPYVECSTPDGRSQLPICTDEGVTGYPTWDFPDGSRVNQVLSLKDISNFTQCPLPQDPSTASTTETDV